MRSPEPDRRRTVSPAPAPVRSRANASRSLASLAGVVLIAAVAVGCLPSASRESGATGSSLPAGSAATLTPGPTGPTPRPPIIPPTPTPAPTFMVHVVAAGESLNTIAHRFGTTARSIAFWNRATYPSLDPDSATYRPDLLKVGWTLFLIPNLVVDEQDLPGPSADGAVEPDAVPTEDPGPDPADASALPE